MRRVNSLLLIVFLLAACDQPAYQAIPDDGLILAFGDSLTAGVGASPEQSYPNVMAELSGRRVINAGISGETSAEGLRRFPSLLEQQQPDLIILLEGGNDILRNQAQSATKANLAAMIRLARAQQIPVLLLGVPEKSLFSDSADLYQELAGEFELLFMEDLIADLLRTRRYKSDPVHLNGDGYRAMAEAIFDYLQDQGLF